MHSLIKMNRLAGVGCVAVVLATAAAVTQATGETTSPSQAPARADAYLTATQKELAGTKYTVSAVRLETQLDGREVYSLRGPTAECVLVAGADQAAGHSQSIGCVDPADAAPDRPLQTGFELSSGKGYVDLIWASGGAPATKVVTSGAQADVLVGSDVIAAVRDDDSNSSEISWIAADGTAIKVPLLSQDQRNARIRAAAAQANR